ncbi:MAG: hypothetical protein COA41_17605 [Sphingopyxis sp.]|nr:MAG: hypothetical protein COA41_17605 [Sphingopyxis sp.]
MGNIYPRSGLGKAFSSFSEHDGSLLNAMMDRNSNLCTEVGKNTETALLCDAIPNGNWHSAQTVLRRGTARKIIDEVRANGQDTDLVFLIHGFNNTASEAQKSYEEARASIAKFSVPTRKQHFIEIYWDGHTSENIPAEAWKNAQWSGPLVGFKLRQLMYYLNQEIGDLDDQSVRLRFLTHSSGAFVVGAIFGDPSAALEKLGVAPDEVGDDYEFFAYHRDSVDPKNHNSISSFNDLRIGMLAPATSDWTFIGNTRFRGGFRSNGATVLFSIQPDDLVLTKGGLGADTADQGSTGLGVDAGRHYCNALRENPSLADREIKFIAYDFRRSKKVFGKKVSSHDLVDYLDQAANHSSFMQDLFSSDEIDVAAAENQICGKS